MKTLMTIATAAILTMSANVFAGAAPVEPTPAPVVEAPAQQSPVQQKQEAPAPVVKKEVVKEVVKEEVKPAVVVEVKEEAKPAVQNVLKEEVKPTATAEKEAAAAVVETVTK